MELIAAIESACYSFLMDQKKVFECPQTVCNALFFQRIFVVCVAAAALAAGGCGGAVDDNQRPTVVATTTIVADLARQIGGDQVEVVSLMGPGIDPHSYRPTPRDADRLARADLVLASGLHLEGKLGELLERMGRRKPVVFVAEAVAGAARLDAAAGIPDPHVWFDLSLWTACIDPTVVALAEQVPEAAEAFKAAGDRYREILLAAHEEVKAAVATIAPQQRVLVTAHDAFRYFGRAYGIEVVGVQGVSTESEAGLADINRLVDLLVERKVPAVFVETSVPDRSVKAICEGAAARGHEVTTGGRLYSDALGESGSGAETLESAIRANVAVIVEALGGVAAESGDAVQQQAAEPVNAPGDTANAP